MKNGIRTSVSYFIGIVHSNFVVGGDECCVSLEAVRAQGGMLIISLLIYFALIYISCTHN